MFITSSNIELSWDVSDQETDIDQCQHSAGVIPVAIRILSQFDNGLRPYDNAVYRRVVMAMLRDDIHDTILCNSALSGTKNQPFALINWQNTKTRNSTQLEFSTYDLLTANTIYISIRCMNFDGLYSYLHTGPLHVVLTAPDASAMGIHVITKSMTLYPTRDSHQADTGNVIIGWSGFHTTGGTSHLQVLLCLDI